MANLYGGRAAFSAKLDSVFAAARDYRTGSYGQEIHEMREAFAANLGQYAHPNEPVHSLIYMYDYANTPGKAQLHIRQVLDKLYDSGIATGRGYLGDEDNGADVGLVSI
jgi:putative alpha-1,2-mannosidase